VGLRRLDYVLAVHEHRSFTAAARQVHVVQSAVSVSVAALERELGVTLLDRSTRRVHPTEAGDELARHARSIRAGVDLAVQSVSAVAQGLSGTVRLGLMHALMPPEVIRAIGELRRDHPAVVLQPRTHAAGAAGLVRGVGEGDLDLTVTAYDPDVDLREVSIDRLSSERMVLICPPEHRLAGRRRVPLADLVAEPFVDAPQGWGSRASADRTFAAHGLTRHVDIEVNDIATVVDLVRAGLGVALVAPGSTRGLHGLPVITTTPAPEFHVGLARPQGRTPRRAAVRLAELVLRDARQDASPG
jgi:DNA-binding transcriptional LysR family regulator